MAARGGMIRNQYLISFHDDTMMNCDTGGSSTSKTHATSLNFGTKDTSTMNKSSVTKA